MITGTTELMLADGSGVNAEVYARRKGVFDVFSYEKNREIWRAEPVTFGEPRETRTTFLVLEDGSRLEVAHDTQFLARVPEEQFRFVVASELNPGDHLYALPATWTKGVSPQMRSGVPPWDYYRRVKIVQTNDPERMSAHLVPVLVEAGRAVPLVAGGGVLMRVDG